VVVWRGLAERAEKSLKKGMQVFIEGKIRTRKWQDNEGKDRYMTEIVANTLKILEKRDRDESTNYASSFPTREEPGAIDETSSSRSTEDKIDDLPF